MMNILHPENANTERIPELVEWFKAEYGKEYGGIGCADIIGDMPINRARRCPGLIESVNLQAKGILSSYGYDYD